MHIGRMAAVATLSATLVACGSSGHEPGNGAASSSSPVDQPSPTPSRSSLPPPETTVSPIPTPSVAKGKVHDLAWRDYFGAYAPTGRGGPMKRGDMDASGFTHDRVGAAFAAAHYAVTVDTRQPARVWKPAVEASVPANQRGKIVKKFRKSARGPAPGEFREQPYAAWIPNIRVVAYSGLKASSTRAQVAVWARDDADSWYTRTVILRWSSGDWRLVLSRAGAWKKETPPNSLVAYSTL